MTIDNRATISLNDIKAFIMTCTCGTSVSVPLIPPLKLMGCPHCGEQWFQGGNDNRFMELNGLLHKIKNVRDMDKDFKLRMSFELNSPLPVSPASGGKD